MTLREKIHQASTQWGCENLVVETHMKAGARIALEHAKGIAGNGFVVSEIDLDDLLEELEGKT